jgi:hypothetical protein
MNALLLEELNKIELPFGWSVDIIAIYPTGRWHTLCLRLIYKRSRLWPPVKWQLRTSLDEKEKPFYRKACVKP